MVLDINVQITLRHLLCSCFQLIYRLRDIGRNLSARFKADNKSYDEEKNTEKDYQRLKNHNMGIASASFRELLYQ